MNEKKLENDSEQITAVRKKQDLILSKVCARCFQKTLAYAKEISLGQAKAARRLIGHRFKG